MSANFRKVWKHLGRGLAVLIVVALGSVAFLGCYTFSAPRYSGPKSDHFDGQNFVNQEPGEKHGLSELLKWQLNKEQGAWRDYEDFPPGPPPPRRVGQGALRITFINHASVLIQVDGINVLTDPIWSDRCSPVSFAGPHRARPPGIRFEDLPPIDVVLLSHNHYDHMDVPSLQRISRDHLQARVFAGLGNAVFLKSRKIERSEDFDWWQSRDLSETVKLTSVPAEHFSSRGLADRNGTLWTGWVLETSVGPIYFAGDTGDGPHFAQVREKFGKVRAAIVPIGAFRPEWFMREVHVSPEEALKAAQTMEAEITIPMHYGTFRLADDAQDEPVERFTAAATKSGWTERIRVLEFGGSYGTPGGSAEPTRGAD